MVTRLCACFAGDTRSGLPQQLAEARANAGELTGQFLGEGIDGLMPGEFTDLFAVAACGAVVAVAEAVTIPLLRRTAIIDLLGRRSSRAVPTPLARRLTRAEAS